MLHTLHEQLASDYDRARSTFQLNLGQTLNFGFDVVDAHAPDDRAFIFVPNDGSGPKDFTFGDCRVPRIDLRTLC
ncbi:MAG: hypothetical protein AAFU77_11350 [Myxococcota bacterium]